MVDSNNVEQAYNNLIDTLSSGQSSGYGNGEMDSWYEKEVDELVETLTISEKNQLFELYSNNLDDVATISEVKMLMSKCGVTSFTVSL